MLTQEQLINTLSNSPLPWLVRNTETGVVYAAFDLYVAASSYIEKTECEYASIYDSVAAKWI